MKPTCGHVAWRQASAKLRNAKSSFKYVGWPGVAVPEKEQPALRERLVREFGWVPLLSLSLSLSIYIYM
jgi:hypothetical protein